MAATRTQIYLTREQRDRLDERGHDSGLGLAEMIREAVDAYLGSERELEPLLDQAFGAIPGLQAPQRGG